MLFMTLSLGIGCKARFMKAHRGKSLGVTYVHKSHE